MRIALLGTGLIGGSIARALRVDRATAGGTASTITAWSPAGAGPRAAAEAGVVDRVGRDIWDAVDGAEIVVLAGPPIACLHLVDELAARAADLAPHALVTDVASTKSVIVARAAARGLPFVGGHPMAASAIAVGLRGLRTGLDGWLADLGAAAQDTPGAQETAAARLEQRFQAARERLGPPDDAVPTDPTRAHAADGNE